MSVIQAWRPGILRKRPPVPTWAGAIANFANGNNKNISCTYGPEHASRYAFCVIGTANNANLNPTGNLSGVSFDGNACTQIFLQQSGTGHASAWGVALPSGASGTCTVSRSIGNGTDILRASCFTVNFLEDPLTAIDFANYLSDPQANPWTFSLASAKDAVALACILGPATPNTATVSDPPQMTIENSIYGASPNQVETSSMMGQRLASGSVAFSFDNTGAGNTVGTVMTLR